MSHYFQRSADVVPEDRVQPDEGTRRPPVSSRLADLGDRITRAFGSFDRGDVVPSAQFAREPGDESTVDFPVFAEQEQAESPPRFPVGAFGYNRAAVDQHIAALERELERLRQLTPSAAMSITEEIERIGEQTASILVVAHDQAHETARHAEEQAERRVADAAARAAAITAQAKQQLSELDFETDAVWRERSKLIEDVRQTGSALILLASEASGRFPEEAKPALEESNPAPEESNPAPEESNPGPEESNPAPVGAWAPPEETWPAPAESSPAPVGAWAPPEETNPAPEPAETPAD